MPLTTYHWGTYEIVTKDGALTALRPFAEDPDPSRIGPSLVDLRPPRRGSSARRCVAAGWIMVRAATPKARGCGLFVEIGWDEAETLVAAELDKVRSQFGNSGDLCGPYGWASAGRFHHAQSQIHRFLNCIGGYTRSVNTYSYAAAEVMVPHVIGDFTNLLGLHTSWDAIADHCELFVALGGLVTDNGQMGNGGTGRHVQREGLSQAAQSGVEFVNISPRRVDVDSDIAPRWMPVRPNSDTALLLALCHVLHRDGLVDSAFVERYAVGYGEFVAYLDGQADGVVKKRCLGRAADRHCRS